MVVNQLSKPVDDFKIFVCARDDAKEILKNKDNKDYQWLINRAQKLINEDDLKRAWFLFSN